MADQRARRLSRDLALDGTIHSEARLLIERLRTGQIQAERAWLAGWLGHGPAALAIKVVPHAVGNDVHSLEEWLAGFAPVGREAWVRAALAATRRAGTDLGRVGRALPRDVRGAVALGCAWARQPVAENLARAASVARRDHRHPRDVTSDLRSAAHASLRAITEPDPGPQALRALESAHASLMRVSGEIRERHVHRRGGRVIPWAAWERLALIVESVREELVPWLLAERDPLRPEDSA